MNYKAGGYIQIEIPETEVNYKDMDITAHPKNMTQLINLKRNGINLIYGLVMKNPETVERAYSMASFPAEGREIMLNVRIATPPWDRNKNNWADLNPGIASSYIFSRKPGIRLQFLVHMVNFSLMSPMQRCFMLAEELEWHHEIPFISFIQNIKNWEKNYFLVWR